MITRYLALCRISIALRNYLMAFSVNSYLEGYPVRWNKLTYLLHFRQINRKADTVIVDSALRGLHCSYVVCNLDLVALVGIHSGTAPSSSIAEYKRAKIGHMQLFSVPRISTTQCLTRL